MMEGGSPSSCKRPTPFKDEFTDLVLSWSLKEILDENLYKNQVEKIPESFQNVDQYFGSFIYPMLEETRAELASALEILYRSPFSEVTSISKIRGGKWQYDVEVNYWRNRISKGEPYRITPGDILLLSDSKPETASDLLRFGWTYTFASVTKILDDENGDMNSTSTNFKVKTGSCIDDGKNKSFYAVSLTNILTNKRIWNALGMRKNLTIIEKVCCKNDSGEEHCEFCPLNCNMDLEENLETALFMSKLNESQCEAVSASLEKIQCMHKPSVELIWGPPGTGKTKTLSVFLYSLLKLNVRTLVCAPTNVAITELASRLVKLLGDSSEPEFVTCPLGDMLLFGNKDRLKVGSEIEEIFLDHRVRKLVECLAPMTGWKHCLVLMQDFLQDCISQHHIYLDNQKCVEDEIQQSTELKSFLDFARDRFKHIASPLRRSMLTLLTHIPENFLLKQNNGKNMKLLWSLLESIEKRLFESNMTSKELERIFSVQRPTCSENESFADTRFHCLSVLKSLQLSNLELPRVTNRTSIIDFCFKNASLLFCTTSSSYKLLSVEMEPVNLVIIDEAAQVKECESVIPLQVSNVRHAILVGDELQLPAMVSSDVSKEAGFGRSLFERLSSLGHSKHILNMQYRMHPSISRFPNLYFYDDQILDDPNVRSQSYERCYLEGRMFGPYSFINIIGGKEEFDDVGHSRRNMVEVAVIVKLVEKLFKAWNGSKEKLSIGLISPYAAQVLAIQDKLKKKYENLDGFMVKVKSVDGFQGGEEDIIIISTVRSNHGGFIGFLSNLQRTNVALTRARHCLWIIGNEKTLSNSDSVWEALIRDAKCRQCFFNADEDTGVAKAILDVKKELQQLEDLLDGESILFKNARWKVIFSQNFQKSFQKLKSSQIKKLVINMLLKIASGWRPRKMNVDFPCKNSSYTVKQFKVEGYCVVCSIDIMKDSSYVQVLKVWDILPMSEIQKLLNRLDSIFAMYAEDFINRCSEKCFEGNLEVPKSWPSSENIMRYENLNNPTLSAAPTTSAVDSRTYADNSRVNESLLLMKFYSLSIGSVNHLLSDGEGRDVDLPFEVTDEEHEIITFPKSSFILGRSGTGKTTVLTMKLYRRLQQYYMSSGELVAGNSMGVFGKKENSLRQLFVTVSPKLCYAIKKHVSQLKSFAGGSSSSQDNINDMDDLDEMAEFEDIPDTFVGIQPEKYPLIITFQKFLMMLDGTLRHSYFERFPQVRDASRSQNSSFRSVVLQTFLRKNNVTYDRFSCAYWPRFNEKLTKNLDPSRVFTEIMSHIKGGLQACDGKRSRLDYVSLSCSRVSTLSAEKREMIYDIFQDYEKMKIERGEFDLADLVLDVHLRLDRENFSGYKMDFVYIDEVQDLTMRQIALFRHVCENVGEGFVFSGDTAQTIARGIDFRFEDIRSLFYNEFLMKSTGGRREKGLISDTFHLCQNFRTHSGVLRLSQSVVDLICHFFPQSIDVLAPETSLICGESPVLLEAGSDENSILTIFGESGNVGGENWVGFGAEQVILVRDDSMRKDILKYVGHRALILTIVECKGLEFQDVLLYNFFGSSPLSNQWRVLYQYLKENNLLDADSPKSFPNFSESKHHILSSELKQLYVAITRTRQRLWICENNTEVSKPMFDYWRRLGLVQVRKVDDSLAEAMKRASSPEEWKSQGIKLFWEKNYEMATMCFEKAGEETWQKRAKASALREAADNVHSSNSKEARIMLREAAEIFDSIGRAESAAQCFCELEEYERAGNIYLEKCGMSGLRKAGECFALAGLYKTAAEVYCKGNFFRDCLSACLKGKDFDMGLEYMEYWKQQSPSDEEIDKIRQEFLETSALECYNRKDHQSMLKFVRAFSSLASKCTFLRSQDCFEELLVLEEESGNFIEAVQIAQMIGNVLVEVDLLGKAKKFEDASFLILSYVLSNSLWVSRNQGWPLKSFPQKEELLSQSISYAEKVSEHFYLSVRTEAETLSNETRNLSELMESYVASREAESRTGEILSARKLVDAHFQVNPGKYEWESDLKTRSEERFSRNQVSVGTLFYVWTLLKVNILEILECLKRDQGDKREPLLEFCQKYFGVRLLSDNLRIIYLLLNPNAGWIKYVDDRFLQRKRNTVILEARHFLSAARRYWIQELVSVGLLVLNTLEKCSTIKSLSHYSQGICLTYIFDIVKFFIGRINSFDIKKGDVWKLQNFLQLSTRYFEIAFPLDSPQSLSGNMIALRETELSKNLLEEIILTNMSARTQLTYGQIGRVMMIWLGSGKPNRNIYQKITSRFRQNVPWNSFIQILDRMEFDSQSFSIGALTHSFHLALQDIYYNANWRLAKDYISPNCFLYLFERLLILLPHPWGFFFVSKSSFVEWLQYQQESTNPRAYLSTENVQYSSMKIIFDFVLHVIQRFLCDVHDTEQWIRKNSNIDCKYYFPVLILRLFMILCLLCLNAEMPFNVVFKLLYNTELRSRLPREFCEALGHRCFSNHCSYIAAIARAFKYVGDPLVIVALRENNFDFLSSDAIFVDLKQFSCKKEIIKALFPRRIGNNNSCDDQLSPSDTKKLGTDAQTSGVRLKTDSADGGGDMQKNCPSSASTEQQTTQLEEVEEGMQSKSASKHDSEESNSERSAVPVNHKPCPQAPECSQGSKGKKNKKKQARKGKGGRRR